MPSNGLAWALSMFGLDLVELLVLVEIRFSDLPHNQWAMGNSLLELYFTIAAVIAVIQLVGMALVPLGWFRLAGILQIVSSAPHVLKGEGIIGVIGGLQAYRYPALVAAMEAESAGSTTTAA